MPECCRAMVSFNPLAPCGARRLLARMICTSRDFQSTRPLRGETNQPVQRGGLYGFQSTRPLRGETVSSAEVRISGALSIHSPLAGRDRTAGRNRRNRCNFQSTRPLRGETSTNPRIVENVDTFNPLAPCGARPRRFGFLRVGRVFQSTRPLRGETCTNLWKNADNLGFQSTRPLRGETGELKK